MELKDYSYTYQHETALSLNRVNYKVHENAVNFVIGPNGSGKSTLIDALTLNTRFGKAAGQVIGPTDNNYLYVTQYLPLLGTVRCSEITKFILGNVFLDSHIDLGFLESRLDERVLSFLKRVWHKKYNDLSGGEEKLLQLYLFLQSQKEFVVLDEPSAYIDRRNVKLVFDLIEERLKQQTFLIVTHDVRDIRLIPDSFVSVLNQGKIVSELRGQDFIDREFSQELPFIYDFSEY